jgi:hypothetical protein
MSTTVDFSAMLSGILQQAKEATDKRMLEEKKELTENKAKVFLQALKVARSVSQEGEAILAFTGEYSRGKPHGLQLDQARVKARFLMNKKVVADNSVYSRCSASVGGYVAGMPQPAEKYLALVQARFREALDELKERKRERKNCE